VNWLASAEYFHGYVEIEISKKLKPYLLNLSRLFTQFQLKNTIKLKSFYSIRIYELLKQYENIGERTLSVVKLRVMLGIEPDNYANYANFKQKVLLVAQKELTKKSDITFDIFEKKEKRKVEQIKFVIKHNNPEDKPTPLEINKELFERLQKYFCLPEKQAEEVLKKYDEVHIHKVLIYVEREIKKGTVKNIGAYTMKAIKENYQEQRSLFDEVKKDKKNEQKILEQRKQDKERLKDDYEKYKKNLAQKYIANLNKDELAELETNSIILAKNQFAFMLKDKKDIDRNNHFVMMSMESEILKDKRILSINDFLKINREKYQSLSEQKIDE
jgi:plasmid replication initiation protein